MNYRDIEKKRIIAKRDSIFRDPGGGNYKNKPYPFVLQNSRLNLWDGIREDAYHYFENNQVAWWGGGKNGVTGHLLSSQVACLNHLYFVRQREDIATMILRNISNKIVGAEMVDDGFVEFEVVGKENHLGEKSHTRGINATSVDAVMVGKKKSGSNILVMIEWKYTEEYSSNNLYIPARANKYDPLLTEPDCPIIVNDYQDFYFEPYYQLMRQTLLGWKMVQHKEYGCDEYLHLHIIPNENQKLRKTITSPGLSGKSMSDAWKRCLKEPNRYMVKTPEELINPISTCKDTASILDYLSNRYWH